MSGRPARFTQLDLERAIKAAKLLGEDAAVEIAPDGTIRIARAPPASAPPQRQNRPARGFVL